MAPKRKSSPLKDLNDGKNKRLKADNKTKTTQKKSPKKSAVKKVPAKKAVKKKTPVKKSPKTISKPLAKKVKDKKKIPVKNSSQSKAASTGKGAQKRVRSNSVEEPPKKKAKKGNPQSKVPPRKTTELLNSDSGENKTNKNSHKETKQNIKVKVSPTKQIETSNENSCEVVPGKKVETSPKIVPDKRVDAKEKVFENGAVKEAVDCVTTHTEKDTTSAHFVDDCSKVKVEHQTAIDTIDGEEGNLNIVCCSSNKILEVLENEKDQNSTESVDNKFIKPTMITRNVGKFVGSHVSIAGGIENAVTNAVEVGAKSFALFLRSQRQWVTKPMKTEAAERFKENCRVYGFPSHLIIPHGSYLMNCGSPNEETLEKSRNALVDELKRCEMLGLTMFNFHPGSSCGEISTEECLDRIGDSINQAHAKTDGVITVIENMSCQGSTIGGKFEELKCIIDRVKDKSRVGVCFDTCHAFAAGYNIATKEGYEKTMQEFDSTVGFKYLKAVHLNDSMGELGCHRDRHENIGKGKIGLAGFRMLMNDPRFDNIPMVLETPADVGYDKEIKKLYALVNSKKTIKK